MRRRRWHSSTSLVETRRRVRTGEPLGLDRGRPPRGFGRGWRTHGAVQRPTRSGVIKSTGLGYLGLNVAAAVVTLWVVRSFEITFGVPADQAPELRLVQVLGSGFSAMALLRSAIFIVRVGERDIGIGPQALLTVMSTASDRAVDRRRASDRVRIMSEVMPRIAFDRAATALPAYCFQLMQNTSGEEEARVGALVRELQGNPDLPPQLKSRILGLVLLTIVGEDVLRAAVDDLGEILHA